MDGQRHPAPDNQQSIDGLAPVDMIVSLEAMDELFDRHEQSSDQAFHSVVQAHALVAALETYKHDEAMIRYTLQKYQVSNEDISESSMQSWDRTKASLKQMETEVAQYAKAITTGSERLTGQLQVMYERTAKIDNKPFKEELTLKHPKKFNMDGKFAPKEIKSIISLANSTFTFYDKIFLAFIGAVTDALNKMSFDPKTMEQTAATFVQFMPKNWMANAIEVPEDDRFRGETPLFRTPLVQGNKALYASGPAATEEESPKDWQFIVNTVRDFSFRFYTVPQMKTAPGEQAVIAVDDASKIRQRLGQLLILSKRFQARKGYEAKLTQALRRLGTVSEKVRADAGRIQTQAESTQNPNDDKSESEVKGRPGMSDIVQSVTAMINNVTRLVTDYNNTLAGILRLLGSLAYIADLELKAYDAPLRKPTQNEVDGNRNDNPSENG